MLSFLGDLEIMTDSDSAAFSVVAANERSLQTLMRSLALSHGQFALVLVRCNYAALQEQLLLALRERCPVEINELVLPSSATTLHDTILASLKSQSSPAVMILGLESVQSLDDLLIATNQVRDQFRSSFPFPLVLWVNDEVLQKLTRFALDLKTFAASPIKFEFTTADLITLLQQEADSLFNEVIETAGTQHFSNTVLNFAPNSRHRRELEFALRDLQLRYGVTLEPELEAGTSFVLGRDAYTKDQIAIALTHYHQSLAFWQQAGEIERQGNSRPDDPAKISNLKLRAAVLLFHLGLCHYRSADLYPSENQRHCEEARDYFQQCVEVFEKTQRPDLVAKFIIPLIEVLQRLEVWEELLPLAQKSLALHQTYGTQTQLAQDYGFLAAVALERSNWVEAHELAIASLAILEQVTFQDGFQTRFHEQHQSLCLFLLALSQRHLGRVQEALNNLEWARVICHVQYDPSLALKILTELRSLYFEHHQYSEAFNRKQEQLQIERAYGFRAFIGAGQLQPHCYSINPVQLQAVQGTVAQEIAASGRQQDLNRLIERISRADRKLTVIHGPSGVGKSSILRAGLVPTLQQTVIGHRIALPIVVSRYTNWIKELRRAVGEAIGDLVFGIGDFESSDEGDFNQHETEKMKAKIQNLVENQNRLIVLVFDQFEEFFFVNTNAAQRREFALFLRECLNLPFIKVILSLREDYLHYLLECERLCRTSNEYTSGLAVINNNILDKDIRYYLGNFSSTDTFHIIQNLTQHSQYKPSTELINALVQDLAGGVLGEVHPIELQIVGSQLQAENLTTIEQYHQHGPKEKLVERWLEQVIQDCGSENEQSGWKILFGLTDEDGTRPLKTRQDLVIVPPTRVAQSRTRSGPPGAERPSPEPTDLILEILVGSGLVLRVPEESGDRYQLVHDYLVKPIRARDTSGLKAQLQLSQQQLQQRNQVLSWLLNSAIIFAVASGLLAWRAESQRQRADESEAKAQIGALAAASEALFVSNKELDALLESLRAWRQLKQAQVVDAQTRIRVVTALQQAVYGVTETNRLEGHSDVVWGVSFSPDGQTLASASRDQTVKLWHKDGKELQTLQGHRDSVTSVTFSPDGQLLASASWDQTVKLWRHGGSGYTADKTLQGHKGAVYSVSFSPDGQMIATGSQDQTVKLWRRDGHLIRTLPGHRGPVNWVSFSPDGQLIASASDDKTVKLWRQDGRLVTTLQGHRDWVMSVSFSPNGQVLASAGRDKTVKLWSRNGTGGFQTHPFKSLQQHGGTIWSVSFSPSGQELASASDDNTVKLWSLNGTLLKTFKGHNDSVTSVSFSPDNQLLASGSYDKSVKFWSLDSPKTSILQGHTDRVNSVRFSPDAQVLASASNDQTVKLWRRRGVGGFETHPYASLVGHLARVTSVSFHPNGRMLASASYDKTIKLWSLNGTLLKTLRGHSDGVTSVSFSPDGQMLASAGKDKTVRLWRNGILLHTLSGHTKRVNSVQFSPDGQLLASASDDNTVKLWHSDGRLIKTLGVRGSHGWVTDVSFSPTGQLLASANWDNTVRLWSLDGKLVDTLLKGYSDSVNSVSFSRDGQVLAAASWDNTVKLWSLDGKLLKTLNGHRAAVLGASFAPQGQLLASASDDHTVMLWNLDLENLLERGCGWMHDYLQHNSNVKESDRHLCDGVDGK